MKHLSGFFRVLGLAVVMLGLAMTLTMHRAQASLKESLSGFGQQLASLHGFAPHSSPRKLFVNGLEFRIETVATPLRIADALDRFQGLCRSVAQVDLPSAVRENLRQASADTAPDHAGVFRQDAENEGYVACLDVGAKLDAEGLLDHLVNFRKTLRLGSLGQLRYAMARRHAGTTTLVVLWTEGENDLKHLFPKKADAPGRELAGIPRPEQSIRVLSAFEESLPYGIAAYRVDGQSKASVLRGYRTEFEKQGWSLRDLNSRLLQAEKGGRKVLVRVAERRPGVVFVNISDLG